MSDRLSINCYGGRHDLCAQACRCRCHYGTCCECGALAAHRDASGIDWCRRHYLQDA